MLNTTAKTNKRRALDSHDCFLENQPEFKRPRIWEIDFLRGFCIFMMLIDHTMFLLAYTFGVPWYGANLVAGTSFGVDLTLFARFYWTSHIRDVVHTIILFLFFSISGTSSFFSRSNKKRALQLSVVAILFTIVTRYMQFSLGMSATWVHFGVLNMLAMSMIIYVVISEIIKLATKNLTIQKWATSLVCFMLFLTIVLLYYLYTPPKDTPKYLSFLFPPGIFFSQRNFSPGDFFPMIPWSSFFFFGAFAGPILYGRKKSLLPFLDHKWHKPISFLGKHSLLIYVFHIVVLSAIFAVLSVLFITPGNWILF